MDESANSLIRLRRGALAMAGEALGFAFGFFLRHPAAIFRRVAIPGGLGCVALYFLVWSYCAQLIDYLVFPSEGLASRIMGIAAASVLIMLLLHAVVVSRLADLVVGRKSNEPAVIGVRSDAWRLYAANLRFLLGLGLYSLAMFGAYTLMLRFGIAQDISTAFDVVAWLLLLWGWARSSFFLVPICLQTNMESGLGTSWRRSKGHLPVIAGIVLPVVLLTLVLLAMGEFLLRLSGVISPAPLNMTFIGAIGFYQRNLLPFVIMVSLIYLVSASLMTAARIKLDRELMGASPT